LENREVNESFRDGAQYVWDSTSLKAADTCLRFYQYKLIDGWTTRKERVHLKFGAHYATALEHYYKHVLAGVDKGEACRRVVLEALMDTWEREESDPSWPNGHPWVSTDNNKNRETLIRSIVWYIDYFEDDPMEIITYEGRPALEYSFLLPVDNSIMFSGHLDRVVNYAEGNWISDQKTTKSTISPYYFDGFAPDHQMSMYTFAGQAIFHTPIRGVVIDAAQIAVGFTRFERGFTARTPDQLNEWYDCTMQLIESTQRATREQHFPMRVTSCGNYGGCEFRFVCAHSPDVREQFLKGNFDKMEPWNPAKRR
jgi:hypothetical protein